MHELPDMTQLHTYDVIYMRLEGERVGLQTQTKYLKTNEA